MDTVLIVIGILGFGAVVIATYVFTMSARNYVLENNGSTVKTNPTRYIARSPRERRTIKQEVFPFTVNGVLVAKDRRFVTDRRLASA